MGRGVQVVVLCEDQQHEVFVRAFLLRRGFTRHDLRFQSCRRGDAKQFVRERLPTEIRALRRYQGDRRMLIVMTDADNLSVQERLNTLHEVPVGRNIDPVGSDEPVFFFAPEWEIETWLAYLGNQMVDENRCDYPKFGFPGDAYPLVDRLVQMCGTQNLQPAPPPSLVSGCQVYGRMKAFISGK